MADLRYLMRVMHGADAKATPDPGEKIRRLRVSYRGMPTEGMDKIIAKAVECESEGGGYNFATDTRDLEFLVPSSRAAHIALAIRGALPSAVLAWIQEVTVCQSPSEIREEQNR
jgi:hypothetical protein